MTEDFGNVRNTLPNVMTGTECNRTIMVPAEQVVAKRYPINEARVEELAQSINAVGLLSPIVVAMREGKGGNDEYHLVAGRHRLAALKLLGIIEIRCTVLGSTDTLRTELAELDENLVRDDPSPAAHALLTGRRREIIKELAKQDGTLSQLATASNQSKRRAGQKTGPNAASIRDQSNKTGESKDKTHRSLRRFEKLGRPLLEKIVGTSLDKPGELEALAKLPDEVREDLANRASVDTAVSALQQLRGGKQGEKEEESELRRAWDQLINWFEYYMEVLEEHELAEQVDDLVSAITRILHPGLVIEKSGKGTKQNTWFWRRGRKGK